MSGMDTGKCEAFLEAAAEGSITAAASRLGLTQPGVTRILNSLEAELGFRLFVRGKSGVRLTAEGQAFLPAARDVVRAARRTAEVSSSIRGVARGLLTIGSYFSVSAIWMPRILSEYEKLYPGVRVRLLEGGNREMAKWIAERSVDLCFCAEPAKLEGFDWIPVMRDRIIAWLPGNHPFARALAYPLSRLSTDPFIHTLHGEDTDQDRLLAKEKIKPTVRFTTKDGFTTWCMVEAGLGVSFNQELISLRWKGNVALVPVDPPQYVPLGLAIPSLDEASPATKRFISCVRRLSPELRGMVKQRQEG